MAIADGNSVVFLRAGVSDCDGATGPWANGVRGGIVVNESVAITIDELVGQKLCVSSEPSPDEDADFEARSIWVGRDGRRRNLVSTF